ncbi:sulfotransferase [Psychroserpens damuponensis]|uniref:sulfotransferase n=1 Tax=Psychroserpens damuponensis TaxID=943936 RepID=UPI0005915073|nr:sulfotransferase [Psychroserpens damuponensis]
MKKSKIFIIGLHKTGTTSVIVMLEKFGYLVTGPDTNLYYDYMNNDFENIDECIDKYDVFQDDPWYEIFEYIDSKVSNAKFIYLSREENSWLDSVQRFYGEDRYNNIIRRHFYGDPNSLDKPELYLEKYKSHQKRVFKYFEDKTNFIKVDVRNHEDAIKLQKFLGLKIRYKKFPIANKTPNSFKEKQIKSAQLSVKGYFGLNKLVKFFLRNLFDYNKYIEIRSKIRYKRSLFKRFKTKCYNSLLRNK